MPVTELQAKEEKVKVISATVAALRLDAVAAAGYGTSRSRMAEEIKGQNVKVNWQDVKNAAQTVKAGDVLSFQGPRPGGSGRGTWSDEKRPHEYHAQALFIKFLRSKNF
jgi:RNA-binding protein YlmH